MKSIGIVFVIALLVRLLALAYFLPKLNPEVDQDAYRSLARSLAAGQDFLAPSPSGEPLPQVDRTPGYPLFLAGLMRLGGGRLGMFLAVQCLLGAATCGLTFALARRWLIAPAAFVAGMLVALDPNSVVRCCDLRTETLFTLLVLTGTVLLVWRSENPWALLVAGIIWSVATLCRPIAIGLWVVVGVGAGLRRLKWTHAAVFLAGFLPLILVWSARNAALTGRWFFSTAATYNLYVVRASGVEAERLGISHNEMQDRFSSRFRYVQSFKNRETFATALHDCRRAAREILAASPAIAAKQFVRGWFQVLLGPGAHSLDNSLKSPTSAGRWPVWYTVVLALLVIAAGIGAVRRGREVALLSLLVIYFVLLSGGGGGNSRFRTPATPLLAVLAVAGISRRA